MQSKLEPQLRPASSKRFDMISECSQISPIKQLDSSCHERQYAERSVDSGEERRRRQSEWRQGVVANNDADDDAEDHENDSEIPIWICGEPRYISGITALTTCRDIIQALIDDELQSESENGDNDIVHQPNAERRCSTKDFVAASRDLADYVITERWRDVEQALAAETHILPIWLAWGSTRHEIRFKLKINKSNDGTRRYGPKTDGNAAAERLLDKEHHKRIQVGKRHRFKALAKMMKRLVLQSETIQQRLNHMKHNNYRIAATSAEDLPTSSAQSGKSQLLDNFLHDTAKNCVVADRSNVKLDANVDEMVGDVEPRTLKNIYVHLKTTDNRSVEPINIQSTDDELFLLIDNNNAAASRKVTGSCANGISASKTRTHNSQSDDLDSGVHVEYRQYVLNQKLLRNASAAAKIAVVQQQQKQQQQQQQQQHRVTDKLMQLAETPKRKYRTKCDFDRLRARSLNRASIVTADRQPPKSQRPKKHSTQKPPTKIDQKIADLRCHRETIRTEIAARLLDMDELLHIELRLKTMLARRGSQFRALNELYVVRVTIVEPDIERIQSQLDEFAKEIVDGEFELFKIQLEITQKCGVLHNLQRMLAMMDEDDDDDDDNDGATTTSCTSSTTSPNRQGLNPRRMAQRHDVAERIALEQLRQLEELQPLNVTSNEQLVDSSFVDNVTEFCDKNKTIVV